jgi:hypothetical protein
MLHALNRCDKTKKFLLSDGLLYCLLHASNLLCSSSQCWVSLEYPVSFLHGRVLAALTSEASQLITLLGTDALCYHVCKYSKISLSRSSNLFREFDWLTHCSCYSERQLVWYNKLLYFVTVLCLEYFIIFVLEGSSKDKISWGKSLMMWHYYAFISKTSVVSFPNSCLLTYFSDFFISQLHFWSLRGQVLVLGYHISCPLYLLVCTIFCVLSTHMDLFGHLASVYLYQSDSKVMRLIFFWLYGQYCSPPTQTAV